MVLILSLVLCHGYCSLRLWRSDFFSRRQLGLKSYSLSTVITQKLRSHQIDLFCQFHLCYSLGNDAADWEYDLESEY